MSMELQCWEIERLNDAVVILSDLMMAREFCVHSIEPVLGDLPYRGCSSFFGETILRDSEPSARA